MPRRRRVTNEDRIVATLARMPGLDDDELSLASDVKPRHQVNQICRRLEAEGRLFRQVGDRGKIVNRLVED